MVRPVTPDVGELAVVMPGVLGPLIDVHVPVPTAGVLPASDVVPVVEQISWSPPAFAVVGMPATVITTSLVLAAQGLLLIVQRSVYVPATVGVKVGVAEVVLLSWAVLVLGEPARMDHAPVPWVGVLAAKVVETLVMQMVWSGPAFEAVVAGVMLMLTSAVLATQGLLLIVHRRTTGPVPPVCVKVEEPLLALLNVPVPPLTTLHWPVPVPGVLPPNEAEVPEAQIVCVPPTVAVVGVPATVITTSSVREGHGLLLIVQRSVYVPAPPAGVNVAVGEVVLLNWPLEVEGPETTDQAAVPTEGVLAERTAAEVWQMDWSVPAFGKVTWEQGGVQV